MYFISDYAAQLYDGKEAKYNTTLKVKFYKNKTDLNRGVEWR